MSLIEDHCTVGITTKDRPEALSDTLRRLEAVGLGGVRYLIVDDSSKEPERTRQIAQRLPRCRFVAHEECLGLIRSRNEIARLCETPILVVLDDDSCFTDADGLPHAVERMMADPALAVVSFKIVQLKPDGVLTTSYPAGPLLWFRGCGFMVKLSAFHAVGGFPDVLFYGAEESHLIYRLFKAGYGIVHDPTVVVEHNWSPAARDARRMEYHFSRSQAIVKLLNLPLFVALPGIAWQLLRRVLCFAHPGWHWAHLAGTLQGLLVGLRERRGLAQLTAGEWRKFSRLRQRAEVPLLRNGRGNT